MTNRIFRAGCAVIALCAIVAAASDAWCQAVPPKSDDSLATVNGEAITRAEYLNALEKQFGVETLDRLISTKLLWQEAERSGVKRGAQIEKEIQERVQREVDAAMLRRARDGGLRTLEEFRREYETAMGNREGAYDEFRTQLADAARFVVEPRVLIEKILIPRIQVSDEQLLAEFDRQYGPKAVVRQIVVRTRSDAEAVLAKLKAGADFNMLAAEQSIDPVSGTRGGLMEPLANRGVLGAAAFALKEGETSDIIVTDEGCHILKLARKIPARGAKFEDVKEDLREQVMQAEVEKRIPDLLVELRTKGKVELSGN